MFDELFIRRISLKKDIPKDKSYVLLEKNSQFIIATHSPILMAYPYGEIYVLEEQEITKTPYEETEHYILTKQFLNNPKRMFEYLFE